jgi:hypothetical protein
MRSLTAYELTLVAGGLSSGTTDPIGGYPTLVEPPKLNQYGTADPKAAVAELAQFFSSIGDVLASGEAHYGSNQNSDPEAYQNAGVYDSMFMGMFGSLPTVQNSPAAHFFDNLYSGVDPEFLISSFTPNGIAGKHYNDNGSIAGSITIQSQTENHAAFNVNGQVLYGIWHDGTPQNTSIPITSDVPIDIITSAHMTGFWEISTSVLPGFNSNIAPPRAEGNSSPTSNPPSLPAGWNALFDHAVDTAASHLTSIINSYSDHTTWEYSAYVYLDKDGVLRESKVVKGNHNDVGQHTWEDYGIGAGDVVVGMVHNHPDYYTYDNGTAVLNGNSKYIDNGDLLALRTLANAHGAFVVNGVNMTRAYIVHSGGMDEYDYVQNINTVITNIDPTNPTGVSQVKISMDAVKANQ